jgi:ligand-binding sensor domain-containing protein
MKKILSIFNKSVVILLIMLTTSCNSQEKKTETIAIANQTAQKNDPQIGQYVGVFEDSKGNLWFLTLSKGVAKYDGSKLVYLTTKDGLPSNRIVEIVEDKKGNLWFGTGAGIAKFDGKTFTNFSEKDGLCSDMISNLLIDSIGNFWIGTWGGVCTFDGIRFKNFQLPYPKVETQINPDTKDWITSILEDSKGNIWFGRDGYGATKYDGHSFFHYTTKEGLNSSNVQSLIEDNEGKIWIGTRVAEKDNPDPENRVGKGGLNMFNGEKFVHFPKNEGLSENDVYAIYKDNSNDLWFSTISNGVYKYSNNEFLNYKVTVPIMDILEDKKGIIWLGCAGGLYKIDPAGNVINVTVNGPWD